MKLLALKETEPLETRAALDPAAVSKLVALGVEVEVEAGLGERSGHTDHAYCEAGATHVPATGRLEALAKADLVLRVRKPPADDVACLKPGAVHISFLDPFHEPERIHAFAESGATAISLEMVPRTTLAQKMDAVSSQASLAGYASVILAAARLPSILPMMMTPAGTIAPAKFFVIGAGVAGLQAIATAKRLGARVTAFDVRPDALEQAESLGAKALRIDLGGDRSGTEQGYARQLSPEQLQTQGREQAKVCAQSDVVITTAKVFGRKPPVLVGRDVIEQMRPGSLIIDLAAEGGGNVEGVIADDVVVTDNGVVLIGPSNCERRVPRHATQMLASNFANLIEHFWDAEAMALPIDLTNEILKGCVVTHGGHIVHERFLKTP